MSRWQVMAIAGDEAVARGAVVEFMTAHTEEPAMVVSAADVGVDTASLPWAGRHAVLVPDSLAVAFAHAVAGTDGLQIVERRTIAEASCDFEAAAASRDAAAAIRAALRAPGDVRMTEHAEHENEQASRQDGVGVRRYAFGTRGRVDGSVPGVLAFRRGLTDVNGTGTVRLRLA